jgi:AcrR family transcriptional regulator
MTVNDNAAAPARLRVDAKRNVDALLASAKNVFATSGVDAPAKEIADDAGVGVGTLYRHFPRRSDLITAVLQQDFDECAAAATTLRRSNAPDVALALWLDRYTQFVATKRGLGAALHSGDPAYEGLPAYFLGRLVPVLDAELLAPATASGTIRSDVSAEDLLRAIAHLCVGAPGEAPDYSTRMVALLIDGLRRTDPSIP